MAKCSHKISQCASCLPAVTFLMISYFVLSHVVRAMVMLYVQIFSVTVRNHCVYYD